MATILSFNPSLRSSKARPYPSGGKATIIIFSGVRYERLDDDESSRGAGSSQERQSGP